MSDIEYGQKHKPILDFYKEKYSWEVFINYLEDDDMVTFLGVLESLKNMAYLEIMERKHHPENYHKSGAKLFE